ncbi:acetyl/propionyl-CoA carboxylase, biotin carboxylase subunit fused with biotin carboxyl carrier subunit [Amycolatopsis mediterranei S699]|uniref:Biotin-dependent 3-methylcrotonyl-coenzyme A carboxylase alpha1 subunit n=2 Tax=Amycolatopsis mediterranei TaxID=33910 RepID=A0A0H3DG01_AMYMU|nr:acetyl-CoA carboxylase biotin carboxylase subunit [Amycolatopsis mediterranei]ADJ49626.1 acetyl/propionyl-CoA carboxylase, biotin carboxylase subunit fused with biotin carboxyl carrier subunit [Amycolatopsis mediterranei U32]AEK46610.1 acetyl/propionyl-CoA carboxylase, biotin carboxylase subunit fused with biotin carboxyl carrier subunit [Amycolatopsis mediterranei S699]AFO81336.1 acetyl/propionyl-CoA carboxylase, biotin carboxylase subunit fused with biotin carboxyl carrier subunit [Amycolat
MFDSVLVANRGEIAVRVIRTLRDLGIRAVAVYSDADADARHVREAHTAVRIGPAEASRSYLSIPAIVDAAVSSGAQAVHPGYGFLAENAEFARACEAAGLVFIGPPVAAIDAMGDKIRAKATVSKAGVPVVPGASDVDIPDGDFASAASKVGYPLLLKPSAGGGGKGMRLVHAPEELDAAIESARREAKGSFGDDTLLMERFVTTPRHIEIQVMADTHGNVIHLGERECSLQRRHQKIIEEAPSVLLDDVTREKMGSAAVEAARSVGYVGAGTVEFIMSAHDPDEFFFMEMNTRLQVEHPVTELVTGLDLVEWQVRVAAGEHLAIRQEDVVLKGHAVEARVYAEDPARGFIPTGGTVLAVHEPAGDGVRVDSWMAPGAVVGSNYDPMLAKVIAWGPDRAAALHRLDLALADTAVLGIGTNTAFLRGLLADDDVRAGRLDTELVDRRLSTLVSTDVPAEFFVAAAVDRFLELQPSGPVVDPWDVPDGWRMGGSGGVTFRLKSGAARAVVRVQGTPAAATVFVDDAEPVQVSARRDGDVLEIRHAGGFHRYRQACGPDRTVWLARDGLSFPFGEQEFVLASRGEAAGAGPVTSPMPGTVLVVKVAAGDVVKAGTPLLVVEAMKMEHTVTAPIDGVVSELPVRAGQQVALDETLAVVAPQEEQQ